MIRAHQVAREALQLRDWARRLLLGDAPPTAPPRARAESWQFFSHMEWCALPLQRRLESARADGLLDPAARTVLEAAAALEAGRVQSARARLAELAQLAQRRDVRIVVLKGGVAVAGGVDLHLEDIDLATDPDTAARLVDELDPGARHGLWTLGQYRIDPATPADVAVEIHDSVRELDSMSGLLAGALPLPGHRGLWRPDPCRHLWHLLTHATATHPDRVARLRDVLLLRMTLAECTETGLNELAARAAAEPEATSLLAVLAMARTGALDPDVERCVRRRYFLLARWHWLGRRRALHLLLTSASEL
ncbi:MAG TPA: hypothetical protein VK939_07020, partial [Longimicrobiales bacterium]|nr:hypothetical protein [Longimicrobiales bacterium]